MANLLPRPIRFGTASVRSLYVRHHPHPRQIQRLPGTGGQRLPSRDLRAALGEDGAEGVEGGVVGGLGGGLLFGERAGLGSGGHYETARKHRPRLGPRRGQRQQPGAI